MVDQAFDWLSKRWWGRALVVLMAPLVFPLVGAILVLFALLFLLSVLTWSPCVRIFSYVRYGDQYVLGNWWWTIDNLIDFLDGYDGHKRKTREARDRLRLK